MEQYIRNNVSDITYPDKLFQSSRDPESVCIILYRDMSELTPHPENHSYVACWLGVGLNSRI